MYCYNLMIDNRLGTLYNAGWDFNTQRVKSTILKAQEIVWIKRKRRLDKKTKWKENITRKWTFKKKFIDPVTVHNID